MARPVQHRGMIENGPGTTRDLIGCAHCRMQIEVTPPKGAESFRLDRCGQCHATICPKCAAELAQSMKCAPFEKRLERVEAQARLREAAGV